MNWFNVKLIFARELRDQMRDRRTLFTVAIMPLLLYPLMGMAMLQVAPFMRQHATDVWIVGTENLPQTPALTIDDQFNPEFVPDGQQQLLELHRFEDADQQFHEVIQQFKEGSRNPRAMALVDQLIQREMQERKVDVAVFVPRKVQVSTPQNVSEEIGSSPAVYVFFNSATDKSKIGSLRVQKTLAHWQQAMEVASLAAHGVDVAAVRQVQIATADVADQRGKQTAAWSKILPLVLMIWSLTGAFYPAIDLCAGEKERGTFETLLSSPAERSEIAIGKLLTVMAFSMATSLLNLLSMGFTGMFVVARLGGGLAGSLPMGPPPISSLGWLVLALIPVSALFSAIALAAAAFARSSKEGQYYLVPLMMISMPLMMVPMLPGAHLDFGSSLIPVSGLMLLLRGVIEGQHAQCLQFVWPVCGVTLICCTMAIRWVVHQFNSETVMFRASERFGVGTWVRHVMRERHELPSFGNAILCGVVILVAKFFIGFAIASPHSFAEFAKQTITILVASIAVPAIMMAVILTRNPRKSLRLQSCSLPMCAAAMLAAIFLNPLLTWFTALVMAVYPPGSEVVQLGQAVDQILASAPNIWAILLVFAVAPAIFEEIAFRGFILSGFESLRNKWQAILLAGLLFGVAHGVIQQTVITFGVGVILGVIAIQTRSIWPCMIFHLTHNGLAVLLSSANATVVRSSPLLSRVLYSSDGQNYQYGIIPGILMSVVGILLIIWFVQLDVNVNRPSSKIGGRIQNLIQRWVQPKQT